MIRITLESATLCRVRYEPSWFGRLLGNPPTDREAYCDVVLWRYSVGDRQVEPAVHEEIQRSLRLEAFRARVAEMTGDVQ